MLGQFSNEEFRFVPVAIQGKFNVDAVNVCTMSFARSSLRLARLGWGQQSSFAGGAFSRETADALSRASGLQRLGWGSASVSPQGLLLMRRAFSQGRDRYARVDESTSRSVLETGMYIVSGGGRPAGRRGAVTARGFGGRRGGRVRGRRPLRACANASASSSSDSLPPLVHSPALSGRVRCRDARLQLRVCAAVPRFLRGDGLRRRRKERPGEKEEEEHASWQKGLTGGRFCSEGGTEEGAVGGMPSTQRHRREAALWPPPNRNQPPNVSLPSGCLLSRHPSGSQPQPLCGRPSHAHHPFLSSLLRAHTCVMSMHLRDVNARTCDVDTDGGGQVPAAPRVAGREAGGRGRGARAARVAGLARRGRHAVALCSDAGDGARAAGRLHPRLLHRPQHEVIMDAPCRLAARDTQHEHNMSTNTRKDENTKTDVQKKHAARSSNLRIYCRFSSCPAK